MSSNLKDDETQFSEKISLWDFWTKRAESWVKLRFLEFYGKLTRDIFQVLRKFNAQSFFIVFF